MRASLINRIADLTTCSGQCWKRCQMSLISSSRERTFFTWIVDTIRGSLWLKHRYETKRRNLGIFLVCVCVRAYYFSMSEKLKCRHLSDHFIGVHSTLRTYGLRTKDRSITQPTKQMYKIVCQLPHASISHSREYFFSIFSCVNVLCTNIVISSLKLLQL